MSHFDGNGLRILERQSKPVVRWTPSDASADDASLAPVAAAPRQKPPPLRETRAEEVAAARRLLEPVAVGAKERRKACVGKLAQARGCAAALAAIQEEDYLEPPPIPLSFSLRPKVRDAFADADDAFADTFDAPDDADDDVGLGALVGPNDDVGFAAARPADAEADNEGSHAVVDAAAVVEAARPADADAEAGAEAEAARQADANAAAGPARARRKRKPESEERKEKRKATQRATYWRNKLASSLNTA